MLKLSYDYLLQNSGIVIGDYTESVPFSKSIKPSIRSIQRCGFKVIFRY